MRPPTIIPPKIAVGDLLVVKREYQAAAATEAGWFFNMLGRCLPASTELLVLAIDRCNMQHNVEKHDRVKVLVLCDMSTAYLFWPLDRNDYEVMSGGQQ